MAKKIKVKFTRKLFENSNGFSVYAAEPTAKYRDDVMLNQYGNISLSGDFQIQEHEMFFKVFTVTVEHDVKAKYKGSYRLIQIHYDFPDNAEEQWEFLREGDLVTYRQYLNIADFFGRSVKILDLILNDHLKLTQVVGIGTHRAEIIRDKVEADRSKALVFKEFGKIPGIGPAVIKAIMDFGSNVEQTVKEVKENPFVLLKVSGIGFRTADSIRGHLGMPLDGKDRILHGLHYLIDENFASTGNTYFNVSKDLGKLTSELSVSKQVIINTLLNQAKESKLDLEEEYKLKVFGSSITTASLFYAESLIYKKTSELMETKRLLAETERWTQLIEEVTSSSPMKLNKEQIKFLELVNSEQVLLLVGPGGAGKSWVTKLACEMLAKNGQTFGLFAPTARAAKVMTEYVGVEAMTIHRGLMSIALAGESSPCDVIIIDEASMIDSELMAIVYRALKPGGRVIIIGDDFQLPSVGPGNILYDFINNLDVPMVKLDKIYRQENGSSILDYATALRMGEFRLSSEASIKSDDIEFYNINDTEAIKELALKTYEKYRKGRTDEDIMMLTPVNNGASGRRTMNKSIQSIVNPSSHKDEIIFGQNLENESDKTYFREGDYITITRNNYDATNEEEQITTLVNGDLGRVYMIKDNMMYVEIDNDIFPFKKEEISENIEHAWSTTIHKAQGGQADIVIILVPTNAWHLSANMLYTAITRAKKKCIVIGNFNILNKATGKLVNYQRETMIALQANKAKQR